MTLTLCGARGVLILAIICITRAVTPDEANAACQAENDALTTCIDNARRRLAEQTNCETLEGFDCPDDIPAEVCRFVCARDAGRPPPEHDENDIDWEEEADSHEDRGAGDDDDDDDAAVFCSFAAETLKFQCAAPSECPEENRARLSCYYQQLCEDPSLGCPLAAAAPESPSPTAAPAAPERDDAATVRLGGVCAAAVWLGVVAAAVWLVVA